MVNFGGWMNDYGDRQSPQIPRSKLKTTLSRKSDCPSQKSSNHIKFDEKTFPDIQISKVDSIKQQLSHHGSSVRKRASYLRASFSNRFNGSSSGISSLHSRSSMNSSFSRSSGSIMSRRTHGTTLSDFSSIRSKSGRSDFSAVSSRR